MKIRGTPGPSRPMDTRSIEKGGRAKTPASPTAPKQEGRVLGEQVQLSAGMMVAGEVEVPDVSRIQKVRDAIESGTFQVDAKAIADRLIAEEF